jgi:hypothetical protein
MGGGGRPSGHVAWRPTARPAARPDGGSGPEQGEDALEMDMAAVTGLLKEIEGDCSPLVRIACICICLYLH